MRYDTLIGGIGSVRDASWIARSMWIHALAEVAALLACCSTPALAETYPLWAGAAANEWEDAAHATVLTDMSRCEPTSAFSDKIEAGRWKLIPYEMMADGPRGKMVWAAPRAPHRVIVAVAVAG